MWNYFGQKSTKILLAFLLLAGAGGTIVAMNQSDQTNINNNISENSDDARGNDDVEDDAKGENKAEDGYAKPKGVSETSGDWYDENEVNSDTNIRSNDHSVVRSEISSSNNSDEGIDTGTDENNSTSASTSVKASSSVSTVIAIDSKSVAKSNSSEKNDASLVEKKVEKNTINKNEQNGIDEINVVVASNDEQVNINEDDKAKIDENNGGDSEENNTVDNNDDENADSRETNQSEISDNEEQVDETKNIEMENPNPDAVESSNNSVEEEAEIREEEEQIKENITARELEQVSHPELYAGWENVFAYNTYPWQNDCPEKQDQYLTTINGIKVGGYVCECVSYVGWKAFEAYGLYLGWGNAYSWDDRARNNGYAVNHIPEINSIGQFDSGVYGHVFWVERLNSDGSIDVTEYNNAYATKIRTGYFYYGDFGTRTIPASEVGQYNYIHLH